MVREAVLITDTDSCIVSFHHWYRYVLENTKNVDMKIKTAKIEVKEQGDDLVVENTGVVEPDYDFYNEQITEIEKTEISYEITDADLNIYKQSSSYRPGKKDPFSLIEASENTNSNSSSSDKKKEETNIENYKPEISE